MNTRELVQSLRERLDTRTRRCEDLTVSAMWGSHDTIVWQAKQLIGSPIFYPVYKWGDYYSHAVLPLILKKGTLRVNPVVARQVASPGFSYLPANETIDAEIIRLGRAHPLRYLISDVDEYARRIADALRKDVSSVEKTHGGYTNVVLCGGKDSLNLLLLPWQNPVVAASAEPNYENALDFVRRNQLNVKVIRLEDYLSNKDQDREILENSCRVDLVHWRWGSHLLEIADLYDKKVVFWKGQMADLYTTNRWKTYVNTGRRKDELPRKVWARLSPYLPTFVNRTLGRRVQPQVVTDSWAKGANLQGSHNGFIREITDCLTLSAYHGPETAKVWGSVELGAVANRDMRHRIGQNLIGRPVYYPRQNPTPPVSRYRAGLSDVATFISLLEAGGIRIEQSA